MILLIRHAKSDWNYDTDDFNRPLNKRGHSNAPDMAQRLLKKGIDIDAFVSSPATRAITTATYFAEVFDVKKKHIITIPALYHASPEVFISVIEELHDDTKNVALFSHNPGITEFANQLTNQRIDNIPTCGIFAVKCAIYKWKDFRLEVKDFWFFDYPKAVH